MSKTWIDFVDPAVLQGNIARVTAWMAQRAAAQSEMPLSAEELQAVAQHLQKLADAAITIHFSNQKSLLGILQKGRFLSTMELVTSSSEYTEARQKAEASLFGERSGVPGIIYGFLSQIDTVSGSAAAKYGTTAVCLKEEVKQRATLTRTDSNPHGQFERADAHRLRCGQGTYHRGSRNSHGGGSPSVDPARCDYNGSNPFGIKPNH